MHELLLHVVERRNSNIEQALRKYILAHKTTRLDIELLVGPIYDQLFQCSVSDDIIFYSPIAIRQKLPIEFRPELP